MSKAVLLSIKPQWCKLIANGKKTVDVRKTRPKLETPFKVYIYCTQNTPYNPVIPMMYEKEGGNIYIGGKTYAEFLTGKVIGEFVCDRIDYWNHHIHDDDTITLERASELSLVSEDDLVQYADLGHFYAWHISDLEIYDTPFPLSWFIVEGNCNEENCHCCPYFERGDGWHFEDNCSMDCGRHPIFRAPQSWCYVEEE